MSDSKESAAENQASTQVTTQQSSQPQDAHHDAKPTTQENAQQDSKQTAHENAEQVTNQQSAQPQDGQQEGQQAPGNDVDLIAEAPEPDPNAQPAHHRKKPQPDDADETLRGALEADLERAEEEAAKLNPLEGILAEDKVATKHSLVVLDHPYTIEACNNVPHFRSYSSALAKSIIEKLEARGETVDLIDLHADNYDPVMTKEELTEWRMGQPMNPQVEDYQRRMKQADKIFLVFPIWWEQMPAMMKGFADKVYAKNLLYEQHGLIYKSLLKPGVELFVYTVQGAPKPAYRLFFDNVFVRLVNLAVSFRSGIKRFHHKGYTNVNKMTLAKRQKLLRNVKVD